MGPIVILDLDLTLIGVGTVALCYYLICHDMDVENKTKSFTEQAKHDIVGALRNGLCRPFLDIFIRNMQEAYPDVEFFVYTASKDPWATLMVECVEECYGIKFNRPIFSRTQHTIFGIKVLALIIDDIQTVLQLKHKQHVSIDCVYNQIIVIDDNIRAFDDENDIRRVIVCPKYDKFAMMDIPSLLPSDIVQSHVCTIIKRINETMYLNMDQNMTWTAFIQEWQKLVLRSTKNAPKYPPEQDAIMYWKSFDVTQIQAKLHS